VCFLSSDLDGKIAQFRYLNHNYTQKSQTLNQIWTGAEDLSVHISRILLKRFLREIFSIYRLATTPLLSCERNTMLLKLPPDDLYDAMSVDSADDTAIHESSTPESIMAQMLQQLRFLENRLLLDDEDEDGPFQMVEDDRIEAEERKVPTEEKNEKSECVDRLQLLWTIFLSTVEDLEPVMSRDAKVIDLLQETGKILIEAKKESSTLELEAVTTLLETVSELLEMLRPVDLNKLYKLLSLNQRAGDCMEDKDVLLFLGDSGAGKTTTIQFLAGASFDRVEVDGRFHLRAVTFPNSKLREFKTSSGTESVTKSVQCCEVKVDGESTLLCDVPGFNDTEGAEVDMANGLGIIRAIQRAKSVKLVLVVSKTGMGDRFSTFLQTLDTITRLMGENADAETLKAFSYVFTKFKDDYKSLLHKQFSSYKKHQKGLGNGKLFLALLDDIISKTNPEANIVSPLDGDAAKLLKHLWSENDAVGLDPKDAFSAFISESANNKLRLQLTHTRTNLQKAISCKRYDIVEHYLDELNNLAEVLREAKETQAASLKSVNQCLQDSQTKLSNGVRRFQNIVCHNTFSADLQELKRDFSELALIEPLRISCAPDEQSIEQVGCDIVKKVTDAVGNALFQFEERLGAIEEILGQIDPMTEALSRLKEIHEVFDDIAEARHGYLNAIDLFTTLIEVILSAEEDSLSSMPCDGEHFSRLNSAFVYMHSQLVFHAVNEQLGTADSLLGRQQEAIKKFEQTLSSVIDWAKVQTSLMHKEVDEGTDKDFSPPLELLGTVSEGSRDLLLAVCSLSRESGLLSRISVEEIQSTVRSLDEALVRYLRHLVEYCEISLKRMKDGGCDGVLVQEQRTEILQKILSFVHCQASERKEARQISPEEYAQLSNVVGKAQQAIHFHSAKIVDEADTLKKEMAAISNSAGTFLRQLKSAELQDTVAFLDKLCLDGRWTSWEDAWKRRRTVFETQEEEKKQKKWTFFGWLGFGNKEKSESNHDEQDAVDALDRILVSIIMELQDRIHWALQNIEGLNEMESHQLIKAFFEQRSGGIVLFVELLKLQKRSSSLFETIIKQRGGWNLEQRLSFGEATMTKALQKIRDICSVSLREKKFLYLAEILALFKDSPHVIDSMRSFVSTMQVTSTNETRKNFIECVRSCYDFDGLKSEAFGAATQLGDQLNAISFLDEESLKTANEHDRYRFYWKSRGDLKKACHAARLVKYTSHEETILDLQRIHSSALASLIRETQKIGDHLLSLLLHFPHAPADFYSIYVWATNLSQIVKTFATGEAHTVAARAKTLSEQAERTFLECLTATTTTVVQVDEQKFLDQLINLKKAAIEICCWRKAVNEGIDKVLFKRSKQSPNSGRFILDLSAKLNALEGEDATIANQILSEHQCFEGAMNAVFNSATARQDIDYVIGGLDIPAAQAAQLKKMYEQFVREYIELVHSGLLAFLNDDIQEREDFLKNMAVEANILASDFGMTYESQITSLSAQLFAFWSLRSTNSFVRGHQAKRGSDEIDDESTTFLKKPHAAQLVAVWTMLNFKEPAFHKIENQMCELKTGEGKSVVLGVTATILALMGSEVSCVCYSSYLSGRDYSDFKHMFHYFGATQRIRYSTIEDVARGVVFDEHTVDKHAQSILLGRRTASTQSGANGRPVPLQFLLVDEVDILFKKDFYGASLRPCASYEDETVSELIHYIWTNKERLDTCSILGTSPANKLVSRFPVDARPLVEREIKKMVDGAKTVASDWHKEYHIFEGKIGYKKLDGICTNKSYGYQTTFAYVKECEAGNISHSEKKNRLGMKVSCGEFSYAELPVGYDAILGVTGTLKGLCGAERAILEENYNIKNYSYIPSVYGVNKLQFAGDCSRGTLHNMYVSSLL